MFQLEYTQPDAALCDMISVFYTAKLSAAAGKVSERAAIAQLRIVSGTTAHVQIGQQYFQLEPGIYIFGPTATGVSYWCETGEVVISGAGILPAGWDACIHTDASLYLNHILCVATGNAVAPIVPMILLRGDVQILQHATQSHDRDTGLVALSRYFTGLLPTIDNDIIAFSHTIFAWLMADVSPVIDDLVLVTGLSARQVSRLCKQYFGMPPKMLARKYRALRAARALANINGDSPENIVRAFYDQSHMIREIKIFAGETPGKIRQQRDNADLLIDQRRAMTGAINRLATET